MNLSRALALCAVLGTCACHHKPVMAPHRAFCRDACPQITGATIVDATLSKVTVTSAQTASGPLPQGSTDNAVLRSGTVTQATIVAGRLTTGTVDGLPLTGALANATIIGGALVNGSIVGGTLSGGTRTTGQVADAALGAATIGGATIKPNALWGVSPTCATLSEPDAAHANCIPAVPFPVSFEPADRRVDRSALRPVAVPGVSDVVVDGRTGAVFSDHRLRFRPGDFVRVVLIDVNPFLFRYRIAIGTEQPYQEASPLNFLSLALGQSSSTATPGPPLVVPSGGRSYSLSLTKGCSTATSAQLGNLQERAKALNAGKPSPRSYINDHIGAWHVAGDEAYKIFLRDVSDALDARLGSKDLRTLAYRIDSLATALETNVDSTALVVPAYVDAFNTVLAQLQKEVAASPADPQECPALADVIATLQGYATDVTSWQASVTQIQTQKAALAAFAPQFSHVWSDESRFWQVVTAPRNDASGDLIVTVERQTLPQPKPVMATTTSAPKLKPNEFSATVTGSLGASTSGGAGNAGQTSSANAASASTAVGGTPPMPDSAYAILAQPILRYRAPAFFTVGVGAFYTPLAAPQFSTQQRRVTAPPGAPADSVINQIVVSDNSGGRVVPAATLSMLFPQFVPFNWSRWFTPSVVVGATILPKAGAADFGLVAGLGANLFQGKFSIIPGVYISTQNYLINGYKISDEVLNPGVAPVASHTKVAFTIGASYRVY